MARRRIERRRRLVEQQQLRLGGQGAGQRHLLPFAPGKIGNAAPDQMLDAEFLQQRSDPPLAFVPIQAAQFQTESDIAADIQMREEGQILKEHTDSPLVGGQIDPLPRIIQTALAEHDPSALRAD